MEVAFETTRYTSADGIELVADVGGRIGAPTVVLLHGGGQTRHSWSGAMGALIEAGYRVINYDARGHGESSWAQDGIYTLSVRVRDMRTVLENVAGSITLVGASLGGATALQALKEGFRPAAMVLVDIVPRPDPRGVARIRNFMLAHRNGFASLEEAAAAVAAYNPHRTDTPDPAGLMKNLRLRADGRLYWHWDPRILDRDPQLDLAEFQATVTALKRSRGIPVQLIRGGKSDVVSDDGVTDLLEAVPALEVFNVAEAGHMVAGDRNDIFNQGVISFLQRHVPTRAAMVLPRGLPH